MIKISDGFLILPGAYGTFDEWLEVLVLKKIDALSKPIFVFNPMGFWDHAFKQFEVMETQGFVQSYTRTDMLVSETPEALIEQILFEFVPVASVSES
jgi:predicted Rossmann-fold nucleotide-binding protein